MSTVFLEHENREFRYLGYPLTLGRAERAVLLALLGADGKGLDTYALAEASGVGVGNISSVVSSINKKAFPIGGRVLILSGRSTGYRLAEDL